MGRKQSSEIGKREEILEASREIFLEKGFDGASIRSIMKKAGGEVGLFYYYFTSKEEAFACVLDRFFAGYQKDFSHIVEKGRRNPCRLMEVFFEYVERETVEFRRNYADRMHRTMRWAIREHTMEIIEPFLQQIVKIQSEYYGIAPAISKEAAAVYLTYGVCSAILHEDEERYLELRSGIKEGVSLLMNMPASEQELRIPYPAREADIQGLEKLFDMVQAQDGGYIAGEGQEKSGRLEQPGQPTVATVTSREEFLAQLPKRIQAGEVWVIRREGEVLAALLYTAEQRQLDFLAVHPHYRRRGLGGRLLETVAAQFPAGTELSVPLCQEKSDLEAFFLATGFSMAEITVVSGCSCRKLRVSVPDEPLGKLRMSVPDGSLRKERGE